jgi:hypothetical protein
MKRRFILSKNCMKTCALSVLLLLSVFLSLNVFAQTSAGSSMVLRDHWYIRSSTNQDEGQLMPKVHIVDDGKVISQPGYAAKDWYPTSVPSTVLAALVKNKVYPDPYYGNNLMELPGMRKWDSPEGDPFEFVLVVPHRVRSSIRLCRQACVAEVPWCKLPF